MERKMKPTMLTEKTLPGIVACEHDLRDLITELVHIRGSQKKVAEEFGISKTHLGDILRGNKPIGPQVAAKLGWERTMVFRRMEGVAAGTFPITITKSAAESLAEAVEENAGTFARFLRRFRKA
jgi:hypothetical protein